MTPQLLLDALEYLPESYLAEAEALQKKKKRIWPTVAALAACLCLVFGLWQLPGGRKASDNAASMEAESFLEDGLTGNSSTSSRGTVYLSCRIVQVTDEAITLEAVEPGIITTLTLPPKHPALTFSPEPGQQVTVSYTTDRGELNIISVILSEQEE